MIVERCDVVVIGAGFSGLYAVHRLKAQHDVICFEAGDGVGGTWFWNRYPGARVDVESVQYSYGFDENLQQEWHWPEHFSPQPDLERYANHVADRFHLREHIRLANAVRSMRFDEAENRWHVHAVNGDHVVCRHVIAATGALFAPNMPNWPGRETYKGRILHTTEWPREGLDLSGKRVGLIGTGSTGIQIAPIAAEQAAQLTVFQRTPAFSMPSSNRPMDPAVEQDWKADYAGRRTRMLGEWGATLIEPPTASIHDVAPPERERMLDLAWRSRNSFQIQMAFTDVMTDPAANELVAEFVRNKIRETVRNRDIAEKLCPKTYPIAGKRLCIDSGYYEIYNRDNVTLVDVRESPIVAFTETGLHTADAAYDLDVIIVATGFDAITGALSRIEMTGLDGQTLAQRWREGPTTYLGTMVAGFPNFFMIHGPMTPAAQAQMITTGEWQVNFVASLIEQLEQDGLSRIETTEDAEAWWAGEVERVSHETVHRLADSWYNGANIEGKPRKFMIYVGGFPRFTEACRNAVDAGYRGFARQ